MDSWTRTVTKWIDAGCLYMHAVIRADEYEKDHREVDAKHAKALADFKTFKSSVTSSDADSKHG